MQMDLDQPLFNSAQIAEIVETEILNVHTWTSRGFSDPYRTRPRVRRGRGHVRSYSIRDALRFFLMAQLHKQYRTPLPQGLQLSQLVFGAENFDPGRAGYLVLGESTPQVNDVTWCRDVNAVGRNLEMQPLATVINVKHIFDRIAASARHTRQETTLSPNAAPGTGLTENKSSKRSKI